MTTTAWTFYPSAFDESAPIVLGSSSTSNAGVLTPSNPDVLGSGSATESSAVVYDGHLASFIFLVAGLEKNLRDNSSILFGTGTSFSTPRLPLGSGASFMVERAEWKGRSEIGLETSKDSKWGKYVALKYVRRMQDNKRATMKWKEILLEIRALLHEPIRYHPNIVRLLGLSWGAAEGTNSIFPVLALEYAEYGSLSDLQTTSDPFPFQTKKKLCHDVSKGLSILHACGIVHGDLKHENVLVFANKNKEAEVIYTAKLGDFGGSIMDLSGDDQRALHMRTPPWNAPEYKSKLSPEELKLTDVYSLGLLVWRTLLDGKSPFHLPDFATTSAEELEDMKSFDQLLPIAQKSIRTHTEDINESDLKIIDFVFEATIQAVSEDRSLVRTIAALQVMELSEVYDLIQKAEEANEKERRIDREEPPGKHGITRDTLGVFIAKSSYGDYDYQNEGPGRRPQLSTPDPAEFFFEPLRLKTILDWSLQTDIVHDLELSVAAPAVTSPTQIPRSEAAFALYQCYIHEFGFVFDAERACHWLKTAAETDEDSKACYLAQAWCWRVHQALDITLDTDMSTLRNWMHLSIIRGHRKCIQESLHISTLAKDNDMRNAWKNGTEEHLKVLKTAAGGVGMPYFVPRKLRRDYNLTDMNVLDQNIQAEYVLRKINTIDEIYVNHRGDGLLHMAAALNHLAALKHLVEKYKPNIDIANQADYDTPLLCACRGGHLDCALFLLEKGANPQGSQYADDVPLNWLCAFAEDDIPVIAQKLCAAGALLSKHRDFRLQHYRSTWADHEALFLLPMSPLSRAVMTESLPAVRVLLALGADPLEGLSSFSSWCPVVLAAILTLPRILEVLLLFLDARTPQPVRLPSDMEMLQVAIDKVATITDTTSLESRFSRCGPEYKLAMFETLEMLYLRNKKTKQWQSEGNEHRATAANTMMARMVALGRVDVVDALLRIGHSVEGRPDANPIVEAVKLNHEIIFRLLIGHGANVKTTISAKNGGQLSLLQVSAHRPTQARLGLFIPEYLLRMGIAVDALPDGTRSAFASAVMRQDFELADLLLQHGADVDFFYILKDGPAWTTVFGELIRTPTEKNVESIKYLLGLEEKTRAVNAISHVNAEILKPTTTHTLPCLIADTKNNLSIFHLAALYDVYCTSEAINLFHPHLGTALWAAVRWCNLELVSALLGKGADPNTSFKENTPLKLAIIGLEANRPAKAGMSADRGVLREKSERFKRYAMIADLLSKSGAQQ
ncbi:hypothetical protein BDQ12DRAFT_762037 [Crucibulum laeve]|uniref:Protein kinase domain-containing protein n=1 Tax=Crucibulum laeve TaxID=68775 RepID=A0A5C3MDT3_9AGAR|nr:hypothetical protein BDQ12DRAFT_762037 [Crucibulum laeve]